MRQARAAHSGNSGKRSGATALHFVFQLSSSFSGKPWAAALQQATSITALRMGVLSHVAAEGLLVSVPGKSTMCQRTVVFHLSDLALLAGGAGVSRARARMALGRHDVDTRAPLRRRVLRWVMCKFTGSAADRIGAFSKGFLTWRRHPLRWRRPWIARLSQRESSYLKHADKLLITWSRTSPQRFRRAPH